VQLLAPALADGELEQPLHGPPQPPLNHKQLMLLLRSMDCTRCGCRCPCHSAPRCGWAGAPPAVHHPAAGVFQGALADPPLTYVLTPTGTVVEETGLLLRQLRVAPQLHSAWFRPVAPPTAAAVRWADVAPCPAAGVRVWEVPVVDVRLPSGAPHVARLLADTLGGSWAALLVTDPYDPPRNGPPVEYAFAVPTAPGGAYHRFLLYLHWRAHGLAGADTFSHLPAAAPGLPGFVANAAGSAAARMLVAASPLERQELVASPVWNDRVSSDAELLAVATATLRTAMRQQALLASAYALMASNNLDPYMTGLVMHSLVAPVDAVVVQGFAAESAAGAAATLIPGLPHAMTRVQDPLDRYEELRHQPEEDPKVAHDEAVLYFLYKPMPGIHRLLCRLRPGTQKVKCCWPDVSGKDTPEQYESPTMAIKGLCGNQKKGGAHACDRLYVTPQCKLTVTMMLEAPEALELLSINKRELIRRIAPQPRLTL